MPEGRGSAIAATAALLCLVVLCCGVVDAATYTVGDAGGWSFNTASWPKGRRFRSGDIIVFNYNPSIHNVVAVNKGGYDNCRAPRGAKVYGSGKDQIKLAKGLNFFICSNPGHCESGMKISINAV